MIRLAGAGEGDSSKDFAKILPEICTPPLDAIVDCDQISTLSLQWIRVLMQMQKTIAPQFKKIRLINVRREIQKNLKQEGVEGILKAAPSLSEALVEMGLSKPAKVLDVNFVNPFLQATVNVLETQASTKATAGKVYRREMNGRYLGDISGVIGLISDAFSGSVVISFPANTFLTIMSRMIGEPCPVINKEIEDGAGEIVNIIFGMAKVGLNEHGFGIKTALPSVISGAEHSVLQMTMGPRMVIPFESDAGPFSIEICLSA